MSTMKKNFDNTAAALSCEITALKQKLLEPEARAANTVLATDASSTQVGFIRDLRHQFELADSENVATKAPSED